jgi:hypothetical protein
MSTFAKCDKIFTQPIMDFLLLFTLYRDEADGKISTKKKNQERGKRRDG